jgi:hypothetical protein
VFDPNARIVFRSDDHRYELDGEHVLSVTQAIGTALRGLLGERWYTPEARQRGSAVHAAIHLSARKVLDESSVHRKVQPYFESYLGFERIAKPTLLHSEARIFDDAYRYAGALDFLGQLHGPYEARPVPGIEVIDLVDWKSGGLPRTVGWQTAAYARPVRKQLGKVLIRRWCLQLKKDGSPGRLVCVSDWPDAARHESDYMALLRTAQIKLSYGGEVGELSALEEPEEE